MTRTARLADQGELISTLPYMLGFHPRDELVMVFLRERSVRFTARLDLPPPPGPLPEEAAAPLRAGIRSERPDTVVLIAYDDTRRAFRGLVAQVSRLCRRAGVRVGARLLVAEGRWRELDCSDSRCCPPEGRPVRPAVAVPAVAEFVALGMNPLPDRDSVERFFEPREGERLEVTAPRKAPSGCGLDPWRRAGLAAWGLILGTAAASSGAAAPPGEANARGGPGRAGSFAGDVDAAQRAVDLLADIPIRDALVAWLCPDLDASFGAVATRRLLRDVLGTERLPGDPETLTSVAWRLRGFARSVPAHAQAPVLTLAGAHSWWLGEGVFARVALERAVRLDPSYSLASLLLQMVYAGVRMGPATGAAPAVTRS